MLGDASVLAIGWPTRSLAVPLVGPKNSVATLPVGALQAGLGALVGPDGAASIVCFSLSLQTLDLRILALDLALAAEEKLLCGCLKPLFSGVLFFRLRVQALLPVPKTSLLFRDDLLASTLPGCWRLCLRSVEAGLVGDPAGTRGHPALGLTNGRGRRHLL
jgi:hypothetical protein